MIDQHAPRLPPETVAALIHTALRAQKQGDRAGARTLLRALAARQPDEVRVWLVLATLAETREEQRHALERVITLDPDHPLAQRGLARFGHTSAAPAPQIITNTPPQAVFEQHMSHAPAAPVAADPLAPAVTIAPPATERPIRWPLFAVLGTALLLVLLTLVLVRLWSNSSASNPSQATPALPGVALVATTAPQSATTQGVSTELVSTLPPTSPPATAAPTATPTLLPVPTTAAVRQPGEIVEQGDWYASLLRPEYAVALDGSIGPLQPQGRFVLALVTVANRGTMPTRIPDDLFTLVDNRGFRYRALPKASTVYLDAYGRGQHGDFSMEEPIPGGAKNVSVPLVFDVPAAATLLTLRVGESPAGWAFGASLAPTPTPQQ